jgi:hypothetical protein
MKRTASWASLTGVIASVGMALLLIIAGCSNDSEEFIPPPAPTSTATVIPPAACSGQGLIAIDTVHNVAYAPLHSLDMSGDAQIAAVDLATVNLPMPTITTISLPGATNSLASAYNPKNGSVLVETVLGGGGIGIFEIDTNTMTVVGGAVMATGLTVDISRGGILMDVTKNRAYVAGAGELGILDTSTSPPTWNAGSVISIFSPDSMALNLKTGLIFITDDGGNQIVDASGATLGAPQDFDSTFGITDGVAFDVTTNIMVLSQEVGSDQTHVFNFATLDTTMTPATADNVTVPGIPSEIPPIGEGPGGMAVINCNTHQAIVADEGFETDEGINIKAVQLPANPVAGPLNNNGQPGSMTTADAASAYTIATAALPPDGETVVGMDGDPNSATMDPTHNFFYALGNQATYLIQVDVSNPVFGASPTGGADTMTFWNPPTVYVPLP